MRIIIDARFYGLENAGLGRYVMNLVDEITKIDKKNEYVLLLKNKYFTQLNYPQNIIKVKNDISHYSVKEQLTLTRVINKYNPDLVHFPHFNVPLNYKGKYVVTIHDLVMHRNLGRESTTQPLPIYIIKRLGYKRIFKNAVLGAAEIVVPSHTVKEEVKEYYKLTNKKITVIYEGVREYNKKSVVKDIDLTKKYKLTQPFFIYTGNAYPHKNLKRVIQSIVRLNKHSRVQFAIVCSRSVFTERLEKTIDSLDANNYIKHLGFLEDHELEVLYKKSVGFVFPSLYEGFGLPGLEAIKAGCIAVISDIPVFREIYKDNAIYFDPYRIDSISDSLMKVLELKTTEREKLVKKGIDFVKRYSWQKMARETLKVYEYIIDK